MNEIETTERPDVKMGPRVTTNDRLVHFLYVLIRDEVPPGKLEGLMITAGMDGDSGEVTFSNGHLALYAQDVADRIRAEEDEDE